MTTNLSSTFRQHILSKGITLNDAEWEVVERDLKPIRLKRGEVIIDSAMVTEHLFFVCNGIAASIQTTRDGESQIARFFEHGQLCTNLTSAWNKSVSEDQLVALTDFSGIGFSFSAMREAYLNGGPLDTYWRKMVFETLLFDKDVMSAKTVRDVEIRYQFLVDRYQRVIFDVPDKYIARFLGITPQGLSRFLKKSRHELT
ncbi:MAG: cyclic nucleotide-binding domain-containing protein [Pseudomonadota bacterium]